MVELGEDNENWLVTVRLERLRERGWRGTVAEWVEMCRRLGGDPLDEDPPITSLPA